MSKTGYYTHRDCRLHEMGPGHPECPARLDAIEDSVDRVRLAVEALATKTQATPPAPEPRRTRKPPAATS